MTWDQMLATHAKLGQRRRKAWNSFLARTSRLAALADPRTSGMETLCLNWGNDESKRVWADGWRRWHAYSRRIDALHQAAWDAVRKAA